MPIEQLDRNLRLARDFKIRLGERMIKTDDGARRRARPEENGGYPREVDYFVIDTSEEIPEAKRAAEVYGRNPKALRIMLPMEYDATHPDTGEELVLNRYNRAYARSKGLRCRGTGLNAEFPGWAETSDEQWAVRIAQASAMDAEKVTAAHGDRWKVRCLGESCPKYLLVHEVQEDGQRKTERAPGHDADSSCKRVYLLRAWLLHPNDARDIIGSFEIATGSYHSMVDLQSGFLTLRQFTGGKTALVPLTLSRRPTVTFNPVKQKHYTLAVRFNTAEVQEWAARTFTERFLSDELRSRIRQLEAAPLGQDYESVRDLLPAWAGPGQPKPENPIAAAIENPEEGPAAETAAGDADRVLAVSERNEVKGWYGWSTDATEERNLEALDDLRQALKLYDEQHDTETPTLSSITVGHREWLREHAKTRPNSPTTEIIDGVAREATDG